MSTKMTHFVAKHEILIIIVSNIVCLSVSARVPAIIVFGDSTVDSGNNNEISTMLKSNFEPYGRDFYGGKSTGRFSNGRIPPDFISEAFGLKASVPAYLDPAYNISEFASGVCFASAGTGYDNATSDVLNVIPLWKEVEYYKEYKTKLRTYLGARKANTIIHEALYVVSLGTNDFLENYYILQQRRSQYTIDQYQHFIMGLAEDFLRQIFAEGARKIAFTGLPPMGCLPLERATNYIRGNGEGCMEDYNKVALNFNVELNGFEVAGVACCATGMFEMGYLCDQMNPFTCSDANKYVFWDSFHPSEKTNGIISDYLLKNVLRPFFT